MGRPIQELLGGLLGAASRPAALPGGETLWYLPPDPGHLREARFAVDVSDALAGSLNLRRTLARVVDLAVPALGSWAGVTLWDHEVMRQVTRRCDGGGSDQSVPLRRVPDHRRDRIRRLVDAGFQEAEIRSAGDLAAFGAPAEDAETVLAQGPVPVATAALRAHGRTLGVLAVAGRRGRPMEADLVEALARRSALAMSAALVYEERSTLASTLRSALLPTPLPVIEGVRLGAGYRPAQEATEIGGDFYEFRPDTGGWSFSLGDVCGKGVEAAVLTGQVRQSLRTVSLVTPDPVERLTLLNSALLSADGTSFVTMVHGVMRPVDGGVALRVAAGGHPLPMLRRRDGRVEEVEVTGPIIGMLPDVRFSPAELVLAPGETLLCFTDGLPDAKGPTGFLGTERMADVLADCVGMTAQAIAERMLQTVIEHLAGRPHDDMAILAVQVEPRAGTSPGGGR